MKLNTLYFDEFHIACRKYYETEEALEYRK